MKWKSAIGENEGEKEQRGEKIQEEEHLNEKRNRKKCEQIQRNIVCEKYMEKERRVKIIKRKDSMSARPSFAALSSLLLSLSCSNIEEEAEENECVCGVWE